MILDFIRQNAKTLVESGYLYNRMVKDGKASEIKYLERYILELAKTIKEEVQRERGKHG